MHYCPKEMSKVTLQSDIRVYQTESEVNCVDRLQVAVFNPDSSTQRVSTKGQFVCNSLTVCQHDFT